MSGVTKKEACQRLSVSPTFITTCLKSGALSFFPGTSKVDSSSFANLKEGKHYIVCRECQTWHSQIAGKHLRKCCGLSLSEYKEKHPNAQLMCSDTVKRKAKTEEQKRAQSEKLKARFKTEAGQKTRQQISEASKRMQASGYREKAAAHLKKINSDPEQRAFLSEQSKKRWADGTMHKAQEAWRKANPEKVQESAANARRHIARKNTKLHQKVTAAIRKAGMEGFETEYEVRWYSIDEAHPKAKVAVEIDGCYWHSCPVCKLEGPKEIRALDKRKSTYLKNRGWEIVRLADRQAGRA